MRRLPGSDGLKEKIFGGQDAVDGALVGSARHEQRRAALRHEQRGLHQPLRGRGARALGAAHSHDGLVLEEIGQLTLPTTQALRRLHHIEEQLRDVEQAADVALDVDHRQVAAVLAAHFGEGTVHARARAHADRVARHHVADEHSLRLEAKREHLANDVHVRQDALERCLLDFLAS